MTEPSKKVALVTGGNRGIGKAIALRLAGNGIEVILTYRSNEQEARDVIAEIQGSGGRAAALRLDLSEIERFDLFLDGLNALLRDAFGTDRIDYLVNNAGFGKAIPIDDLTEEDFDAFVDVHFKSVVFLTQKALRRMNDGGGVVFVTAAADRYNVPATSARSWPCCAATKRDGSRASGSR